MKRLWYAVFVLVVPAALRAQSRCTEPWSIMRLAVPCMATITVTGPPRQWPGPNDSGGSCCDPLAPTASVTATRVGYAPTAVANPTDNVRSSSPWPRRSFPVQTVAMNPAPASNDVLTQSDLNRADGLNLIDAITRFRVSSCTRPGRRSSGAHIKHSGYYPSFGGNSELDGAGTMCSSTTSRSPTPRERP